MGNLSAAQQKWIAERMKQMATMTDEMSGMAGKGMMMDADMQKRMDRMRKQMDEMMKGSSAPAQRRGWTQASFALSCSSGLKLAAEQFALPDDGKQCTDFELSVIRHGNGGGASVGLALHDDMAAAPADLNKPVFTQDTADLAPRQDAQFTHAPLRKWSPVSGRAGGF